MSRKRSKSGGVVNGARTQVSSKSGRISKAQFRLLRQANLAGIGYDTKETAGPSYMRPRRAAIRGTQVPLEDLAPDQRLPRSVDGITTDVVPIGRLCFHSRPAHLGAGISHGTYRIIHSNHRALRGNATNRLHTSNCNRRQFGAR